MTAAGVAASTQSSAQASVDGHPDSLLVGEYLAWLSHQRQLAPISISNYARSLGELLKLLGPARLASLDNVQVRRSIARLHANGRSPRTLANMLSAWRGLYHWLVRHKDYAANPCVGVRAVKAAKTLPKALSVEAVQHLLETAPGDTIELVRDHAMFELMYSSGLRRAELLSLNCGDGLLDIREVSPCIRRNAGLRNPQGEKTAHQQQEEPAAAVECCQVAGGWLPRVHRRDALVF